MELFKNDWDQELYHLLVKISQNGKLTLFYFWLKLKVNLFSSDLILDFSKLYVCWSDICVNLSHRLEIQALIATQ